MNVTELEVISSKVTQTGSFLNKLVANNSIDTPLGKVNSRSTYYMFTATQNKKGLKAKLDLDLFDIVVDDVTMVDQETGDEIIVKCKKLYPKRAEVPATEEDA
jgi:hypothetical protein